MRFVRTIWSAWVVWVAVLLLLSGCASGLRSETIIIPDQSEVVPDTGGSHVFEVNTLFRLPGMEEYQLNPWRWLTADALAGLSWGSSGWGSVSRYALPYEQPEKLVELANYPLELSEWSPNGRYFAHLSQSSTDYPQSSHLTLVSIPDGAREEIGMPHFLPRSAERKLMWSSNSRFVSFFTMNEQGEIGIAAYDTERGEMKQYTMPEQTKSAILHTVKLSAEGDGVIVVRSEPGKLRSFVLGKWKGNQFVIEYEHSLHEGEGVEWLDPNRVMFAGTDGTLFVYDRRNGDLSVLKDQGGAFALSADRQYIAYATDEATVEVAKLQGNNLLNTSTVYHGLTVAEMAWSPDNSGLLVRGRKPYEAPTIVAPAVAAEEPNPAPSQRDLYGFQSVVIAFKNNR